MPVVGEPPELLKMLLAAAAVPPIAPIIGAAAAMNGIALSCLSNGHNVRDGYKPVIQGSNNDILSIRKS